MNIAIRVDASPLIGTGHIMRCLTLANLLKEHKGASVFFVCNCDLPESMAARIRQQGFTLFMLPNESDLFQWERDAHDSIVAIRKLDIEWTVIDHYGIDANWEKTLRSHTRRIAVIDDLANRSHDCDILLDQNLVPDMANRYRGLVTNRCKQLLGPTNALLRKEFTLAKNNISSRSQLHNVLINFGGSDPTDEIGKTLLSIHELGELKDIKYHVIAGPANIRQADIERQCSKLPNVVYYPETEQIANMLSEMDLAISAGGATMWERCYLGLPSLVIAIATNQVESAQEAHLQGLIWYLGESVQVNSTHIADLLRRVHQDQSPLITMSNRCLQMMEPLRNIVIHPIIPLMNQIEV